MLSNRPHSIPPYHQTPPVTQHGLFHLLNGSTTSQICSSVQEKAPSQMHGLPPIIKALNEPRLQAAPLPPISSILAPVSDSFQTKVMPKIAPHNVEDSASQRSSPATEKGSKTRKKPTKPRRNWSEKETNNLLLGVNKYGVGKWTRILADPGFSFNCRNAGDLKDRFRTVCPDDFIKDSGTSEENSDSQLSSKGQSIHIESQSPRLNSSQSSSEAPVKQRRSKAHRRSREQLVTLGILRPFKKPDRRERHGFTEQDDCEILLGLVIYGPSWTKIQRNANFHLSSRKATDLRDRVRNKYPSIYQSIGELPNEDLVVHLSRLLSTTSIAGTVLALTTAVFFRSPRSPSTVLVIDPHQGSAILLSVIIDYIGLFFSKIKLNIIITKVRI